MFRRDFLELVALSPFIRISLSGEMTIQSVRGPRSPAQLGVTLMHEHVLVDFIGADKVSRERYNADEAFRRALPHLTRLHELGCRTLVECTPAYIGRDVRLLQRLSHASGMNIITNTGYYGAAEDKFVPRHAYAESAELLAGRWIRETRRGIEGTGIKPGIIKIGVDKGPLSDIDARLVRAAALTHLETGLTIASHTGDGTAALEELDLLKGEGVAASAFIWVHAQNESDSEKHFDAAQRGAWVEFDGVSEKSHDRHIRLIKGMLEHGRVDRTLLSQDAGWYHVGEPDGGNYRSYEYLFTQFLPALKSAGATEEQALVLLRENPRRALTPQVRKLER